MSASAKLIDSTPLGFRDTSMNAKIFRTDETHIKILNDAGLVTMNDQGRQRFCNANPKPLKAVDTWLKFYEQFWDSKLDDLDNFLNSAKS